MSAHPFAGVLPAVTTPFDAAGEVDHAFLAGHVRWLLAAGCQGIVPLGSLGEGATLSADEKLAILRTVRAASGDAPVLPGVAAAATRDAVALARAAHEIGCRGLMVLPPWLHQGGPGEALDHAGAVIAATPLPCMLYNNPPAYGTDFVPEAVAELARRHPNLVAVKESSGDVRRVTAIRAACEDRLDVLVGLDDAVVEGLAAGATGWVAGLVNAFPRESVALFAAVRRDGPRAAEALYRWFLPLLRLDAVPQFVQLIKLCQQEVGRGSERVRPPRQPAAGALRADTLAKIAAALRTRPEVAP